jgi:hypothetical protein
LLLRVVCRVEKTKGIGFDAVALAVSTRHRNSTAAHANILARRVSLFVRHRKPISKSWFDARIVLQLTVSRHLLTHERDQFRKSRCKVCRPAVRALRAGNIERKSHLIKRALQLGGRHTADHCLAFVADNLSNIAADNTIEATAAIWIGEALMRKRGCCTPSKPEP